MRRSLDGPSDDLHARRFVKLFNAQFIDLERSPIVDKLCDEVRGFRYCLKHVS